MESNKLTRRQWLKLSVAAGTTIYGGTVMAFRSRAAEAGKSTIINIGSRRELFVDNFLIENMTGAELKLHKPEPRDVAFVCDEPWEGNTSAYYTLFSDDDRFRAYYRGWHFDEKVKKAAHPEVTCYAESKDGITWTKPKLGVCEFAKSKDNNVIWTGPGTHNFTPFKDANPACAPDARYKALAGGSTLVNNKKKGCLNALKSADGVRWTLMSEGVITAGAFDSQNLAFWDAERGEYRAYWRIFTAGFTDERGWKPEGVRAIRTATSKDFIHWENQADLKYVDSPPEHLYTNAIMPYFRAPHLFIGFPTRYQPKTQQVEPVFMTSRDGILFRRWSEELIPITAPKDRDGNRSNYMTWGLLQHPGNDRELSVYATEAYYKGSGSRVRRFTFRTDGFVSVHAASEGTLITKPLTFAGSKLSLNIASKGNARVELQDGGGKPLPGFALDDCVPITGDVIEHIATWKSGTDLGKLAGQTVRLRFVIKDADLFSIRFQ
ncbi:MAG: hypothetical protein PHR77_16030 [Kiritimatiellae bacterium]|nr:hypothetical protein [Kiritimatiellia bacterium]MDD5523319.1 hypothetical protein [Kiritimatiellia bacterium]